MLLPRCERCESIRSSSREVFRYMPCKNWRCPMFTRFARFIQALIVLSAFVGSLAPLQARSPSQQGGLPQKEPPTHQVLPLDPLTPAERKFAEQIAREDSKVRELLGNRPQLISIALLFFRACWRSLAAHRAKPRLPGCPVRESIWSTRNSR